MKRKIKFNKRLLILLGLAAILIYFILTNFMQIPDLATDGYVEAGVMVENSTLKFIAGCDELSMDISGEQAVSIQNGLAGVAYRPNAHDLMWDLIKGLDAKVLMVKITEMEDGTYFARLIVRKDRLVLGLDSRPSDAVAVAARTDYLVPIYVNEGLMEKYAEMVC